MGSPIPDSIITGADTVANFVLKLATPKPHAKLFDALEANTKLANLSNVNMMGRRKTPIDKDTEVGRWKVIEAELQRRQLPVVGHG